MFVQTEAATNHKHKDGLCLDQRRNGAETLVQWSNGDQRWIRTKDIQGRIVIVGGHTYDG